MSVFRYATCRRFRLVHALETPLRPPLGRGAKLTATLICTGGSAFIDDLFSAFDHDADGFCAECRVALVARHYRSCERALAAADGWTDEQLAALDLDSAAA